MKIFRKLKILLKLHNTSYISKKQLDEAYGEDAVERIKRKMEAEKENNDKKIRRLK